MKKFKLIAIALFLVMLTLSFTACFGHIKDTNGDEDFSLVTITDQDIIESSNYVAWGTTNTEVGDEHSFTAMLFSGVWQIAELVLDGRIVIRTDINVESGNFRFVLVHNGEIIHDFDIHGEDSFTVNGNGKYYFKLAGESAKIPQLNFSCNTF